MTLCDPMDCSLPGSSAHGILQARILEWVEAGAISFSGGSSWPRNWTSVSGIAGRFFTIWTTRDVHIYVCVCVCVCVYIIAEGRWEPLSRTQLTNISLIWRSLLWQPHISGTKWRIKKWEGEKSLQEVKIDVSIHTVKFSAFTHKSF